MFAYEFIARDRAGLKLAGVQDGDVLWWKGTPEEEAEADFQETFFLMEEKWFVNNF